MSEDMPEDMPDRVPEDMPEHISEDMPGRMPEDMPEDMPDRMPEDMPDKMPEDMPARTPGDLPVTKRIDVMVGITRSKVIGIFLDFSPSWDDDNDPHWLFVPSCGLGREKCMSRGQCPLRTAHLLYPQWPIAIEHGHL